MVELRDFITTSGFILTVLVILWGAAAIYGRIMEKVTVHESKLQDIESELKSKVSHELFNATLKPIEKNLSEINRDVKEILRKVGS